MKFYEKYKWAKLCAILITSMGCVTANSNETLETSKISYAQCSTDAELYITRGDFDDALGLLETCFAKKKLDGKGALQLATLYGWFGLGNFKSQAARARMILNMNIIAAYYNQKDALTSLQTVYEYGDVELGINPDPLKVECIDEAESLGSEHVKLILAKCFSQELKGVAKHTLERAGTKEID